MPHIRKKATKHLSTEFVIFFCKTSRFSVTLCHCSGRSGTRLQTFSQNIPVSSANTSAQKTWKLTCSNIYIFVLFVRFTDWWTNSLFVCHWFGCSSRFHFSTFQSSQPFAKSGVDLFGTVHTLRSRNIENHTPVVGLSKWLFVECFPSGQRALWTSATIEFRQPNTLRCSSPRAATASKLKNQTHPSGSFRSWDLVGLSLSTSHSSGAWNWKIQTILPLFFQPWEKILKVAKRF